MVDTSPQRKSISHSRKRDILWLQGGNCPICGMPVNLVRDETEIDHTIPLALGGADVRDEASDKNLRVVHKACHAKKTKGDRRTIAKAKRVYAKHTGTHRKPRRPLTNKKWKRKINGQTVRRGSD